jgi:hypothetical protein
VTCSIKIGLEKVTTIADMCFKSDLSQTPIRLIL